MTYNLRPLHLRLANGVAETKGYNGAGMNPWRTAKSQVKRLVRDKKGVRYTNDDGSAKAKGLPPVTKEIDNSGECVGGDYEWTLEDRKTAAEQNERTLAATGCETAEPWQTATPTELRTKTRLAGADYCPNMVYRKETCEWVDMTPATVEWVTCEGHHEAKPSQDLRRKARPEGVGATDKQWEGQLKTPVTAQAKPIAYDNTRKTYEIGAAYWYEVERLEGFAPATTEERDAALAEQIQTHGKTYRARHARQCKVWETKQTSWKQLTNVAQGSSSWISLDDRPEGMEGDEPAWTPTTADRMAELAEAAESYENQQLMRRILARMTDKQREAIELKAMGIKLTSTQRRHLQMARAKVK